MAAESVVYIVANTVDPYGYELPVILAYPAGCKYRARFKKEWIDDELLAVLPEIQGRRCLIVYRHFETGHLYPIRYGKVSAVETYGEVVYVEYTLGPIVTFHNRAERRHEQLAAFIKEWKTENPKAASTNQAGEHMKPLVFESKYIPKIENPYLPEASEGSREFESWSNLLDLVCNMPMYAGMEFLRIVDLLDDNTGSGVSPRANRYQLAAGRSYELRLAQRVYRPVGPVQPHTVEFRCSGQAVQTVTQHRRAVGKYDVLSFRFRTERMGLQRGTGVLSIVGRLTETQPLELEVLCEVRPKWPVVGSILTLVGGVGLVWPGVITNLGVKPELEAIFRGVATMLFVWGVMDIRSVWEYFSRR